MNTDDSQALAMEQGDSKTIRKRDATDMGLLERRTQALIHGTEVTRRSSPSLPLLGLGADHRRRQLPPLELGADHRRRCLPPLGLRADQRRRHLPPLGLGADQRRRCLPPLGLRAEHRSRHFPTLGLGAVHRRSRLPSPRIPLYTTDAPPLDADITQPETLPNKAVKGDGDPRVFFGLRNLSRSLLRTSRARTLASFGLPPPRLTADVMQKLTYPTLNDSRL